MPPTTREVLRSASTSIHRAIAELEMLRRELAGGDDADKAALRRRIGELRADVHRASAVAAMAAVTELQP